MQFTLHLMHLVTFSQLPLLLYSSLIRPTEANYSHNSNATHDDRSSALSPDDTLFAHLRCFELFASNQSTDRDRDASIWLSWNERYLQKTERTPNFVRCVLSRMGLYHASSGRFNENLIRTQYNEYKHWMTLGEDAVDEFINAVHKLDQLATSDDEIIYSTFKSLLNNHSNAFFQLFLRDAAVLQNMYEDETFSVRKPNQTVVQFCELQMSTELWNDICLIRAYEISNHTEAMESHITCIFRGFQYLNVNNSIDEEEIARDFELIESLEASSREYIQQCAFNVSQKDEVTERSLAMYECLLDGTYSDVFKEAFDFHEVRSGNLTFILKNLPYDRDQVKQQILALDKEHCNDRDQLDDRYMID